MMQIEQKHGKLILTEIHTFGSLYHIESSSAYRVLGKKVIFCTEHNMTTQVVLLKSDCENDFENRTTRVVMAIAGIGTRVESHIVTHTHIVDHTLRTEQRKREQRSRQQQGADMHFLGASYVCYRRSFVAERAPTSLWPLSLFRV